MGKRTILQAENMTLGTGSVLAAFRTGLITALAGLVEVTRVEINQSGSTTLAMIRGELATRDALGTLTMTVMTPRAVRPQGGPVSGLTGNIAPAGGDGRAGVNSSADTGGTYTTLYPFNFPNLNGYLWKPDPSEQILVPASTVFVVRFLAAPATLTGWTVSLFLDELG